MDESMVLKKYKDIVQERITRTFDGGFYTKAQYYIYGIGAMGRFVYEQVKDKVHVKGFLESHVQKQGTLEPVSQLQIYGLQEIDKKSNIIIASLTAWSEILHICIGNGYMHCCNYEELAFVDPRLPHWDEAFVGMADSIIQNRKGGVMKRFSIVWKMICQEKSLRMSYSLG